MTIIELPTPLKVDNPNYVDDPVYWEDEPEASICGTNEAQGQNVTKITGATSVSHIVVQCGCGTKIRVAHACASVPHIKKT